MLFGWMFKFLSLKWMKNVNFFSDKKIISEKSGDNLKFRNQTGLFDSRDLSEKSSLDKGGNKDPFRVQEVLGRSFMAGMKVKV